MSDLLANGELDLAIDVAHPEKAGLKRELLREDSFVVAARKGHPAIGETLDLETYLSLEHVFASPRSVGLGHEDAALSRIGRERKIAVRCQNAMSAWQIVSRSDMLLTLSRRYAETFQGLEGNQLFDLPLELPSAEAFMYWHDASEADPGLGWLREQIRAVIN